MNRELLNSTLDRIRGDLATLEAIVSRPDPAPQAAPVPSGPDLVPLTVWCRTQGVVSLRTARRWCEPGGDPSGLLEAGVFVRVGSRWLVSPARFQSWVDSTQRRETRDDQEQVKKGPGRPRRIV